MILLIYKKIKAQSKEYNIKRMISNDETLQEDRNETTKGHYTRYTHASESRDWRAILRIFVVCATRILLLNRLLLL